MVAGHADHRITSRVTASPSSNPKERARRAEVRVDLPQPLREEALDPKGAAEAEAKAEVGVQGKGHLNPKDKEKAKERERRARAKEEAR